MQDQTYILAFIFAGLAWAGLLMLAAAAYGVYLCIRYPKPKATEWEKEWKKIEEEISK